MLRFKTFALAIMNILAPCPLYFSSQDQQDWGKENFIQIKRIKEVQRLQALAWCGEMGHMNSLGPFAGSYLSNKL